MITTDLVLKRSPVFLRNWGWSRNFGLDKNAGVVLEKGHELCGPDVTVKVCKEVDRNVEEVPHEFVAFLDFRNTLLVVAVRRNRHEAESLLLKSHEFADSRRPLCNQPEGLY